MANTHPDRAVPSGRDLLSDGAVRFYLATAALSSLASFLLGTALAKQVYDVTGSALALGMLGLVEFLPAALLVPITGSVADRFDRRRVVTSGLAGEVVCAILLAWYAFSDPTSATPLFLIAIGFGTCRAFVSPAIRSLPPLIGPVGGLPRLIALLSVTGQLGMIIGPASSGFLYDVDTALPYLSAAVLFAVGAVGFAMLRPARPQHRTPADQRPSLHHAMEGLRLVRHNRVLLGAIALDLFAVLFGGAYALLPAIAEERLGVGNIGYGWLRAAPGVGAIIVTALLALRPLYRHIGRTLLTVVAIFGVATLALGITTTYAVAFVALIVLAGADAVSVFIRSTIVPLATPDAMRGRVMAVENVFIGASNELGAFESGVAAHFLGLATAVVLGGVATCAVVGIWWFGFAELRDIDRFSDLQGHAQE